MGVGQLSVGELGPVAAPTRPAGFRRGWRRPPVVPARRAGAPGWQRLLGCFEQHDDAGETFVHGDVDVAGEALPLGCDACRSLRGGTDGLSDLEFGVGQASSTAARIRSLFARTVWRGVR